MAKALLRGSNCNPLTEEEWERFFSLIDMSQVPEDQREDIKQMFKKTAKRYPMARSLCREQTGKFAISLTANDEIELRAADAAGLGGSGHITWRRDLNDIPSTAIHEMRHIQQFEDNLWALNSTREYNIIANKMCEAECRAISDELEGNNSYFSRLLFVNQLEVKRALKEKDIPYADGLSAHEKTKARNLYIYEQAHKKTMAQYMALLMQEDGLETVRLASSYGVDLGADDLQLIEEWRSFYKNQALESSQNLNTIEEAGLSETEIEDAKHMHTKMIKRYPELKNLPFFQTGFSGDDLRKIGAYDDKNRKLNLQDETSFYAGTNKKEFERKHEGTEVVSRMYRNDATNSVAFEEKEEVLPPYHKVQTYYDRQGNVILTKKFKNNQLVEEGSLGPDGVFVSTKIDAPQKEGEKEFEWVEVKDKNSKILKYRSKQVGDFTYYEDVYRDGRKESYYLTEDMKVVGPYVQVDSEGHETTTWYSGQMKKDKKTGELKPEKIINPAQQALQNGYTPVAQDKVFKRYIDNLKKQELIPQDMDYSKLYIKTLRKGEVDIIGLNEAGTLALEGTARTRRNGEMIPIDSWRTYHPTGELEEDRFYNKKGEQQRRDVYHPGEEEPHESEYVLDGKEHKITYGGNGVILSERVYDLEQNKVVKHYSKYKNKALYSETKDGETKYYSHQGNLTAVETDTVRTDYYEQTGVKDPTKLQKKQVDTFLYDENGEYQGRKIVSYRKDGSISRVVECDVSGKGTCTYYGPDGKTKTAEGAVQEREYDNISKEGEWIFYKKGEKVKATYQDNQIVSGDPSLAKEKERANTHREGDKKPNASALLGKVGEIVPAEPHATALNNQAKNTEARSV